MQLPPQPITSIVGRNLLSVKRGGPVDRDRLGRIVDAGILGALDITFVRSLYLLVIISSITLGFAELTYYPGMPVMPALTCLVVWVSYRRLVKRQRALLGRLFGNLISIFAIARMALDVSSGRVALMSAVGSLLGILVLVKLLQNKRNRDFVQVLLLSFGQMLVAAVLTQELWFGVAACTFLLITTWVLLLFHFKREGDGDFHPLKEQIVDWRMFRTSELISRTFVGVMLVALMLTSVGTFFVFITLPRFSTGWLDKLLPSSSGGSTGLSDTVRLGGSGEISRNERAAFAAAFDQQPDWPVLYRTVVQDEYDPRARQWAPQVDAYHPVAPTSKLPRPSEPDVGTHPANTRRCEISDQQFPRILRQLAVPGRLVPTRVSDPGPPPVPLVERAPDLRTRASQLPIHVAADLLNPARDDLYFGDTTQELRLERFTKHQVDYVVRVEAPAALTPEYLQATARPTARFPANSFEFGRTLRDWAQANMPGGVPARRNGWNVSDINRLVDVLSSPPYEYTLQQETPPVGVDPILYFLLDRKAGHCEYYASALCMILLAHGVDARLVTGFSEGPTWRYDDQQKAWVNFVTYACAHAWVEVYVIGYGWQPFNPSPQNGLLPTAMSDWDAWIAMLQYRWRRHVVQFDSAQQQDIWEQLKQLALQLRDQVASLGSQAMAMLDIRDQSDGIASVVVGALVVVLPLTAVVLAWRRWRSRRRPARLPRSGFRPMQDVLALCERLGFVRRASQTPAEFMRDAGLISLVAAEDREQFLAVYHHVRFGEEPLTPAQQSFVARVVEAVQAVVRNGGMTTVPVSLTSPAAQNPSPAPPAAPAAPS
ncbi:MAG: DUF3488 and transglutaminase-like domain-containing protein [Planctomycetota bacterium]